MMRALVLGSLLSALAACGDDVGSAPSDAEVDAAVTADAERPLPSLEEGELLPGGATTLSEAGASAFLQPAANLSLSRRGQFEAGLQFFRLQWVPAPGRADLDGLGPTYNADSCIACHIRNGRSLPAGNAADGVLLRLGPATGGPDPYYGDQLQPRAVPGVPAEARVERHRIDAGSVTLGDGTEVALTRVEHELIDLGGPPLATTTLLSPRVAQQLVGMGLLEAIPDVALLAGEDPDDVDGDGISGRAAHLESGDLGRFGWKAAEPTVVGQTAAAFHQDLGLTSELRPEPNCPHGQTACAAAPSGGEPELVPARLAATAAYVRLLGVPPRRGGDDAETLRGKALFAEVGCAACHTPSFETGAALEPELTEQHIWPYTDLLLHDMGDDLADGRPEGAATGVEWRTAPLWGLGLVDEVNGGFRLLHDGRARSLAEAILWHGGEAARARAAYRALSAVERAALERFVLSL